MRNNSHRPFIIIIFTLAAGFSLALVLPWLADLQGLAAQSLAPTGDELDPEASVVYHVSKTGNGSTGLDWTNAFTSPQDALNIVISGDEIWVATGVYTPGIDREDSFVLVSGVAMYGGFAGTETLKSERDWEANLTILSGDIEGDDTNVNGVVRTYTHINGDNSLHVVKASGIAEDTILDGFTITAGYADYSWPDSAGGGLLCDGHGIGNVCSPRVRNINFSGNFGDDYAGAVYHYCSNEGSGFPFYNDVIFTGNHSNSEGGAVYNESWQDSSCQPYFQDVIFKSNSADDDGGAIYENGISTFVNVLFSGNFADNSGGAIQNESKAKPLFYNVTISGNRAPDGGGIYNDGGSTPYIYNSVLWNNQDDSGTGTISSTIFNNHSINFTSTVTVTRSIVQGAGSSGSDWLSDPRYIDGGGNIDQDPLFISPVNPATSPSNTGDLHLQENSPARDVGDNNYVNVLTDLDGNPRIANGIVDMGVYEYQIDYPFRIYQPLILK